MSNQINNTEGLTPPAPKRNRKKLIALITAGVLVVGTGTAWAVNQAAIKRACEDATATFTEAVEA